MKFPLFVEEFFPKRPSGVYEKTIFLTPTIRIKLGATTLKEIPAPPNGAGLHVAIRFVPSHVAPMGPGVITILWVEKTGPEQSI